MCEYIKNAYLAGMTRKVIFLFLFLSFFINEDYTASANAGRDSDVNNSKLNRDLLLKVFNDYRTHGTRCGRKIHTPVIPFAWSDQLTVVAQQFSDALHANRSNPAFVQRGGFDFQDALRNAEYDYMSFFQSHARLTPDFTEKSYVEWLMDNEGACNQIMDAGFTEIGVAKTELFWVLVLAAPKIPHYWNVDSININLLVEETNRYREMGARCGNQYFPPVEPVVWNERLAEAAQLHSNDMKENQFFDHTGTGGSTLVSRVEQTGYRYRNIGENIAMGETQTEVIVVEGWMNSPGHCRNIMNGSFTEMGVARSGIYWTQVFGRPWSD